jgi:hypothetical protein
MLEAKKIDSLDISQGNRTVRYFEGGNFTPYGYFYFVKLGFKVPLHIPIPLFVSLFHLF